MSKYRDFNPKMISEWHRIYTGLTVYTRSKWEQPEVERLVQWCEENTRGRWSYGSNDSVHWSKLQPITQGDHTIVRSFFFREIRDAIRFKLLFF